MKMKKDSRLPLKILSAFTAVILWFAITYTEDPIISQYLNDITIVFEGEGTLQDNGLIVTNKDSLPAISAVIRGNRSNVISSIGAISAVIDVSQITSAGSNIVPVKYSYPASVVTLAKGKTGEVALEIEKIVSRNIPVRVETANEDKNTDYMVESTGTDKTVKVRGAESVLYKINYAKAIVDVTNITKTSSQDYFYKFYDENGDVVPDNNIIYKSLQTVNVENEVYNKVSVPVKIVLSEEMQEDYVLSVKNASLATVEAGVPEGVTLTELTAVFDTDIEAGGECELLLTVPDGVYLPKKYQKITAQCQLVPKVLKELEIPVSAQNVPEGKKVILSQEKILVTVKGAESSLTADKIKASIDAQDVPPEAAESVEVTVTAAEDIKIIGTYTVTAKLE